MSAQQPLWGTVVAGVRPPPEMYARGLRTLVNAWQEAVLADPLTTPAYRAYVSEAVGNAHRSLDNGASAYLTLILSVAPVFAAADEQEVQLVALPDATAEAPE